MFIPFSSYLRGNRHGDPSDVERVEAVKGWCYSESDSTSLNSAMTCTALLLKIYTDFEGSQRWSHVRACLRDLTTYLRGCIAESARKYELPVEWTLPIWSDRHLKWNMIWLAQLTGRPGEDRDVVRDVLASMNEVLYAVRELVGMKEYRSYRSLWSFAEIEHEVDKSRRAKRLAPLRWVESITRSVSLNSFVFKGQFPQAGSQYLHGS